VTDYVFAMSGDVGDLEWGRGEEDGGEIGLGRELNVDSHRNQVLHSVLLNPESHSETFE
jgi:hypothetical protein